MSIPIKTQEEIEKSFFHIPFWQAPERTIFQTRSVRFAELAELDKTEWKNYLHVLSQVCDVQHALLQDCTSPLPALEADSTTSLPTIDSPMPAEFPALLQQFYTRMKGDLSDASEAHWQKLLAMDTPTLTALVQRVLQQDLEDNDQDYSIWVHAVLQILWTHWALQLTEVDVPTREEREQCPCCASDAVGAVVLKGSDLEGLRYLHCNLCNSRWHALRAKCTFCGNTKNMSLQSVEGVETGPLHGASGECCEACHGYRKTYHLTKEQYADPVADDLATLAVDILLSEMNFARGGANPFLILEKETTH